MGKSETLLAVVAVALFVVASGISEGNAENDDQGAVEWCKEQCENYHATERYLARERYLECQRTAVNKEFCDIQYAEAEAAIDRSEQECKDSCEGTSNEAEPEEVPGAQEASP
ncbi:MAG: hypothetical protein JW797_08955 [Bradymonadales bacterium]|nr:hypothetical protein [Bradymonadales bacterium]